MERRNERGPIISLLEGKQLFFISIELDLTFLPLLNNLA
jgi:hypothetical protein